MSLARCRVVITFQVKGECVIVRFLKKSPLRKEKLGHHLFPDSPFDRRVRENGGRWGGKMAAFFVVVGRSRHCRVFLLPFYPCLGPFTSHGVNFSIPLVFLSPNGITNSTTA